VTIEEIIYKQLSEGQTAQLVASNIFPVIVPQETKHPFVRYIKTSISTNHCKNSGKSILDENKIQIDIWTQKYDTALQIVEAVRADLEGYEDLENNLHRVIVTNCRDGYESETNIFRKILTIEMHKQ